MNLVNKTRALAAVGLGLVLAFGGPASRADAGNVQILLRVPVHEAFAAPLLQLLQPPPVVPAEPPAPINELLPLLRPAGNNVRWIPGYWSYDDDAGNFVWVTGLWRRVPPGKRWVPGSWVGVEGGWQRSPGFWADARRAELFQVRLPLRVNDLTPPARRPGI